MDCRYELLAGKVLSPSCPKPYLDWVKKHKYTPPESPRTIQYRSRQQQAPETKTDEALVASQQAQ